MRGEVIGINTMIISNGRSEGNIGIGFAVPINTVRDLLPQLRQGKVVRGRIGVSVGPVPREGYEDFGLTSRAGAIVASVAPGGAAAKGGLEPGDVIVQFKGRPVSNRDELVKMVVATPPGTTVPVKILRNKQERTLNVTIDELDLEAEQALAPAATTPTTISRKRNRVADSASRSSTSRRRSRGGCRCRRASPAR